MEFYAEDYVEMNEALPEYGEPLESARSRLSEKYPLICLSTHTKWRYHTCFQNSRWLRELNPEPELEINPKDARDRGLQDGEVALIYNDRGRCKAKAKVTEGMRPGVVNIEQGWWMENFIEGSHQSLTHDVINRSQEKVGLANTALYDGFSFLVHAFF